MSWDASALYTLGGVSVARQHYKQEVNYVYRNY